VEELKNRAKGSVSTKNYPEAIQLYSKAIEVKPNDAILLSNRSMCYLSMGKATEALLDAEQSIVADAGYAKAYFRKGSALVTLKNFPLAKETFEEGLKLAPGDKSFITQLHKLSSVSMNAPSTQAPVAAQPNTSTRPQVSKKSPPSIQKDLDELEESSTFRGYKKTSDGRTTTFFNNELDSETKALIGDIAPKKIDPAAVLAENSTSTGESVWNKAGTWEERVHTPWAIARLRELLGSISLSIADRNCGEGSAYLKNVTISGDAQVKPSDLLQLFSPDAGNNGERESETHL
jgi:tetratricopeptide (TPR) repeat protein